MYKEANYLFPEGLPAMLDRIYQDHLSCIIVSGSQYASCACALQQWGISHYSTFSVLNQQA